MTTPEHLIAVQSDAEARALVRILEERRRQRSRWPEEERTAGEWLAILVEEVGEVAHAQKGERVGARPEDVDVELVQVAAVCLAMLEANEVVR